MIVPLVGLDSPGWMLGCLRAGEPRNVFFGDVDLGNGACMLFLRSARTAVGSGIVLLPICIDSSMLFVSSAVRILRVSLFCCCCGC